MYIYVFILDKSTVCKFITYKSNEEGKNSVRKYC